MMAQFQWVPRACGITYVCMYISMPVICLLVGMPQCTAVVEALSTLHKKGFVFGGSVLKLVIISYSFRFLKQ